MGEGMRDEGRGAPTVCGRHRAEERPKQRVDGDQVGKGAVEADPVRVTYNGSSIPAGEGWIVRADIGRLKGLDKFQGVIARWSEGHCRVKQVRRNSTGVADGEGGDPGEGVAFWWIGHVGRVPVWMSPIYALQIRVRPCRPHHGPDHRQSGVD